MTHTASRPLTPYQYRKMEQMAQKEDWGTLHIHGLFTLPSGDIYIQFSKGNGAAPPTHILQHTHVLYALPLGALGSKDVLLYELPRVCFNVVAYDTPPYPLKALAYDLVADDYYQITKKDIVAIELEHIKVEAENGKGLGTHLLGWGLAHVFSLCYEYGKSPAYVYGEVMPEEESCRSALLRFYGKNGFTNINKWVYMTL